MKTAILVVSVVLGLISAWFFVAGVQCFFGNGISPGVAAKNVRIKAALERRAAFIDESVRTRGVFPAVDSYVPITNAPGEDTWTCKVHFERDPRFPVPPWPNSRDYYMIELRRGEWSEFYDSHSRKTSLDDHLTAESLRPLDRETGILFLCISAFFGALPAWVLWRKDWRGWLRNFRTDG